MRLELTGPAMKAVQELSALHGMSQVAMMTQLVEFFITRNKKLQIAILGRFPEEMQDEIAKLVLKSLA